MRETGIKRKRRVGNRAVIRYSVWFYSQHERGENREEQTPIRLLLLLLSSITSPAIGNVSWKGMVAKRR